MQTAPLAAGFGGLIVHATRLGLPVGLLFQGVLIKMQAERALGETGAGVFLNEDEARAWLAERLALHPAQPRLSGFAEHYAHPPARDGDRTPVGPFAIHRDPVKPVLNVTMRGFWDVATVNAYTAALDTAIARAVAARAGFGILIDGSNYPVQSAEATQRFGEWYATWPSLYHDATFGIAIIVASMLNKIQAERASGPPITVFLDRPAATHWLERRTPPTR